MPPARRKKKAPTTTENDDTSNTLAQNTIDTTPDEPTPEKRRSKYRETCPAKLKDRLVRATSQRMYLIQQTLHPFPQEGVPAKHASRCDFSVLGSTGNVYTVQLKNVPSCNCPDFSRNHDLCKHIIFILLKVIGVPSDNPLAFQQAYLSTELDELINMLNHRRVGGIDVMANDQVQANFAALRDTNIDSTGLNNPAVASKNEDNDDGTTKRRSLDDSEDCDCPVCFDPMEIGKMHLLTFCRAACGANFHTNCIARWLQNCSAKTCPNCRQKWIGKENEDVKASSKPKSRKRVPRDDEFVNLGSVQGLSNVRDTSTYHSPSSTSATSKRNRHDC
jgi:SWIM zinc finger/Ring finger domain